MLLANRCVFLEERIFFYFSHITIVASDSFDLKGLEELKRRCQYLKTGVINSRAIDWYRSEACRNLAAQQERATGNQWSFTGIYKHFLSLRLWPELSCQTSSGIRFSSYQKSYCDLGSALENLMPDDLMWSWEVMLALGSRCKHRKTLTETFDCTETIVNQLWWVT